MQLAQILNNTHVLYYAPLAGPTTYHLTVSCYEQCNGKLDHFGCDKKWDWYERGEQLEIAYECEESLNEAGVAKFNIKVYGVLALFRAWSLTVPPAAKYSDAERQN